MLQPWQPPVEPQLPPWTSSATLSAAEVSSAVVAANLQSYPTVCLSYCPCHHRATLLLHWIPVGLDALAGPFALPVSPANPDGLRSSSTLLVINCPWRPSCGQLVSRSTYCQSSFCPMTKSYLPPACLLPDTSRLSPTLVLPYTGMCHISARL